MTQDFLQSNPVPPNPVEPDPAQPRFVGPDPSPPDPSRYARQTILPEIGPTGQARLARARVLIVGAGGLGATVIPALAGAGVGVRGAGRITLVDPDHVSECNLHRQTLFRMADIGRAKVACAADAIAGLNPDIDLHPRPITLDAANAGRVVAGMDLVIDCADSFAVSYVLSDACAARAIPMIHGAVLGRRGHAAGICGGGPSLRAVFPDLPSSAASCATAGVMGPAVALIGALQAQMALSLLLDLAPSVIGLMMSADLADWRVGRIRFDGAPEPDAAVPFIARSQILDADCVLDLRGSPEAPQMATAAAIRMAPASVAEWTAPAGRRIVLCCRSGVRAWACARQLQARGHGDVAVLALGG